MSEPLHHRPLWQAIGIALVAFVIYQSLTPAPIEVEVGEGNRLGHLTAYGTLMIWYCQLYSRRSTRLACMIGFVLLGIGLEVAQGFTGYRTFDPADMMANAAGTALGWLLAPPRLPNFLLLSERFLPHVR